MKFVYHDISSDFSAGLSANEYEYNALMLADKIAVILIDNKSEIIDFLNQKQIYISKNTSLKELHDKLLLSINKKGVSNVLAYLLADKEISEKELKTFSINLKYFVGKLLTDNSLMDIYEERLYKNLSEELKKRKKNEKILKKSHVFSYIIITGVLFGVGYLVFRKPEKIKYAFENFIV